ncbi:hypothetical protein GF343_02935 [Candidatus Woesearchaeota archaeon]|nr:hypothetical protein [Candidatus Woesearchaeota archaeon]
MVYAKQIESAGVVGEIDVPSEDYLDKELFYWDRRGNPVKKENLTLESMLGIHRIDRRRHSAEGVEAKHLAKRAVEKLSTRPDALFVAHDEWPVPIPAVAGIAQYVMGYENAAFCDIITNADLPGSVIAQALVDSGKYKSVVYASSCEVSEMRTKSEFSNDQFTEAALLFEQGKKPRHVNQENPESVDFVIVDHRQFFRSRSDFAKSELDWAGVQTMDVIAGCPGYVVAVDIADALIKTRMFDTITCVGAEALEKMADPRHLDHTLYGSAAGATTYQASPEPGVLCSHLKGFGNLWDYLKWGDGIPLDDGTPAGPYLVMKGHQLYRFVKRELPNTLNELVEKSKAHVPDLTQDDIMLLLHQMNGKLIEHSLGSFLGIGVKVKDLLHGIIPEDLMEFIDNQVPLSVQVYGNSSSATIPVTEDHARREIIRSRFSGKSFEDKLRIGSGTIAIKESAGAGFIVGGYSERL